MTDWSAMPFIAISSRGFPSSSLYAPVSELSEASTNSCAYVGDP